MTTVFFFLLFFLGLSFGSFLGVMISRYNPDKNFFEFRKMKGRSKCVSCARTLSFFELIPFFSFLFQRAKCRGCKKEIPFQDFLIETLGGIIFVSVPLFLNKFYMVTNDAFFSFRAPVSHYILVILWILVFLVFLSMFFIDLKYFIIPDELNIGILILGILVSVFLASSSIPFSKDSFLGHYSLIFSPDVSVFVKHILGAAFGMFFFGTLYFLSRERGMGMGDVKLAFSAGFLFGWPDIAFATGCAFIIGGVWSAFLFFSRVKGMKDRIPFAPFFVLGFMCTFFFGLGILSGYFSLFEL